MNTFLLLYVPNSLFGLCVLLYLKSASTIRCMLYFEDSNHTNVSVSVCVFVVALHFPNAFVSCFQTTFFSNIEHWHRIWLAFMVNNAETITLILFRFFFFILPLSSFHLVSQFVVYFCVWSQTKKSSLIFHFTKFQWISINFYGAHWSYFFCR